MTVLTLVTKQPEQPELTGLDVESREGCIAHLEDLISILRTGAISDLYCIVKIDDIYRTLVSVTDVSFLAAASSDAHHHFEERWE